MDLGRIVLLGMEELEMVGNVIVVEELARHTGLTPAEVSVMIGFLSEIEIINVDYDLELGLILESIKEGIL